MAVPKQQQSNRAASLDGRNTPLDRNEDAAASLPEMLRREYQVRKDKDSRLPLFPLFIATVSQKALAKSNVSFDALSERRP